jgi:hypothetical protein
MVWPLQSTALSNVNRSARVRRLSEGSEISDTSAAPTLALKLPAVQGDPYCFLIIINWHCVPVLFIVWADSVATDRRGSERPNPYFYGI